ncbi:Molybdenum cofactor synthesis protein 3 [Cryomyces antarcticus]|nr:Molybdenum cofactor synthesis protein 3 [Cryomyces antarcticus]
MPWSEILADDETLKRALKELPARRQITVKIRELRRRGGAIDSAETDDSLVMDIEGGLRAWTRDVDPEFPEY